MPSTKAIFGAAILFLSAANAHMILNKPVPYGRSSINSSPLDASGADFPCKQRPGVYEAEGADNKMAIGEDQELSFTGGATHGGGSCQVSLTTDKQPSKSSKWQVIHSIEGGCPSDASQNLSEDPADSGSTKFKFQIPQGIKPGEYTLAWTWFNKIGNREMYMNCAPVTVTGGKKRDEIPSNITQLMERDTTFPDMFVANIPATDCRTADSQDLQFPNPGPSVQKAGSGSLTPPTGPKCGVAAGDSSTGGSTGSSTGGSTGGSTGASPSGSGSGAGAGAGTGSGATGGATAPTSSAAPAPAATGSTGGAGANPFGSSGSGNGSGSGTSATPSAAGSAPAATASSPAASAPAAPAPATGGSGSTGSSGGAGTSACDSPGQSICSPDGTKIGTCDTNKQVTWVPVASGTKCSGGVMVMAAAGKRSAKFRI